MNRQAPSRLYDGMLCIGAITVLMAVAVIYGMDADRPSPESDETRAEREHVMLRTCCPEGLCSTEEPGCDAFLQYVREQADQSGMDEVDQWRIK